MATEEVPVAKESLEEKLGDLKIGEPEKVEEKPEAPAEETPEVAKEAAVEEPKECPPVEETPPVESVPTETPVETPDVDTKPPSKASEMEDKISATLHKIVGKE